MSYYIGMSLSEILQQSTILDDKMKRGTWNTPAKGLVVSTHVHYRGIPNSLFLVVQYYLHFIFSKSDTLSCVSVDSPVALLKIEQGCQVGGRTVSGKEGSDYFVH